MSQKSFFVISILFISGNAFSQSSPEKFTLKKSFWSLNYSYGISGTLDNYNFNYPSGEGKFNTIEASYIPKGNVGFFASYSTTNFNSPTEYRNETLHNYELAAGARFYWENKKMFFSVGAGYYDIDHIKYNYFGPSLSSVQAFGLNFGLGARIKLSDSYGVIINGKIHNAALGGLYSYAGLSAGLEINNSKEYSFVKTDRKISTGFIAGSVGNSNSKSSGSVGAEITYKISDKFSLVGSYTYRSSTPANNSNQASFSEKDYAGGIRFYAGENRLKFFLESLVDLNIHNETTKYSYGDYSVKQNSLGIVFGAGTEFKLIDNFSGILKANVAKFDMPGSTKGIFAGLKFRF